MSPTRSTDSSRPRPYRLLTTLQMISALVVLALLGVLCLYVSGWSTGWLAEHKAVQSLIRELGALFIVAILLGGVWELVGKRAFAREVLETARTSADVETAGVTRIGTNYLTDPDWADLFHNVRELDVFLAYGSTWRNTHLSHLHKLASEPGGKIRVFLPDPEDPATMSTLATRFAYTQDDLQSRIEDARKSFAEMVVPNGATIEVYFRPGDRLFSFYRFDSKAVITLYNHTGTRATVVPTLVFERGGSLYAFIEAEIRAIERQSRPAALPVVGTSGAIVGATSPGPSSTIAGNGDQTGSDR
jgi:hypothetical protein